MTDNKIKDALDHIEPNAGAEQRMYCHIIEKSSHSRRQTGKALIPVLAAAAACLVLLVSAGLFRPGKEPVLPDPPVLSGNHTAVGSPMTEAEGPEELEAIGVSVQLPGEAAEASYFLIRNEIAKILFRFRGNEYTLLASAAVQDDFSMTESAPDPAVLSRDPEITLSKVGQSWKAAFSADGVRAYLLNGSNAPESDVRELALSLSVAPAKVR